MRGNGKVGTFKLEINLGEGGVTGPVDLAFYLQELSYEIGEAVNFRDPVVVEDLTVNPIGKYEFVPWK